MECPLCEVGLLTPITYSDVFQHNETKILVSDLEGHQCSNCNAVPILTDQIKRNQIKIADAKKLVS